MMFEQGFQVAAERGIVAANGGQPDRARRRVEIERAIEIRFHGRPACGIDNGHRFLLAFANARQYGNGLVIAPDADPGDGLLNGIVVDDGRALRQLWRARRLLVNRLRPAEGVRRMPVREASITGALLMCHVDGEPFRASGRLEVRVEPGALRVAGLARAPL